MQEKSLKITIRLPRERLLEEKQNEWFTSIEW